MIRGAAAGEARDREDFARRYGPVVRAYLGARWRGQPLFDYVDDAAQEVFLECFKAGGALDKADSTRPGGFRAFLFGIARNVAARQERRRARQREQQPPTAFDLEASDEGPATAFDRAWARAMMREAVALHRERAQKDGESAVRRWELAIPQYNLGHLDMVHAVEDFEVATPGLWITGNLRGGVSISDCVEQAHSTSQRVSLHLRAPSAS